MIQMMATTTKFSFYYYKTKCHLKPKILIETGKFYSIIKGTIHQKEKNN